jgi:DNA-directed RNA polymerase sigma subunit (sigma70/sigma32)
MRQLAVLTMSDVTLLDLIIESDVRQPGPSVYDGWRSELDRAIDLAGLTAIERHVLARRHGLDGEETAPTLEQVGDELGVRETASKYEKQAIAKIEKVIGRKIVL